MKNKYLLSLHIHKGFATLSFLFMGIGMLWLIFILNEYLISNQQKLLVEQQHFAQANFKLQYQISKQIAQQKLCQDLSLPEKPDKKKLVQLKTFALTENSPFKHYVFCQYELFLPNFAKKNYTEEAEFLHSANFTQFKIKSIPTSLQQPASFPNSTPTNIYYFNQEENHLVIQGKVTGIFLAQGNLNFQGDGEIRGIIIATGKLKGLFRQGKYDYISTCLPEETKCKSKIKLLYDRKSGDFLSTLGQWHYAQHSWHDFEQQFLTE